MTGRSFWDLRRSMLGSMLSDKPLMVFRKSIQRCAKNLKQCAKSFKLVCCRSMRSLLQLGSSCYLRVFNMVLACTQAPWQGLDGLTRRIERRTTDEVQTSRISGSGWSFKQNCDPSTLSTLFCALTASWHDNIDRVNLSHTSIVTCKELTSKNLEG